MLRSTAAQLTDERVICLFLRVSQNWQKKLLNLTASNCHSILNQREMSTPWETMHRMDEEARHEEGYTAPAVFREQNVLFEELRQVSMKAKRKQMRDKAVWFDLGFGLAQDLSESKVDKNITFHRVTLSRFITPRNSQAYSHQGGIHNILLTTYKDTIMFGLSKNRVGVTSLIIASWKIIKLPCKPGPPPLGEPFPGGYK
ncbi:hypothetical protein C8R43DRAFT_961244 [Mycena crocata]|nr:hypothetical protein C8R43DRAFT_961244 [Mycena crocata]